MILYADTSALTKRYLEEAGSQAVQEYLSNAEYCYTSALTELELVAAIESSKRIRRINSPEYRAIAARIDNDIRQGLFSLTGISAEVLTRAIPMIRVRKLKSPDAIQLATALEVNKRIGNEVQFLCADRLLLAAARKEGLRCRDVSA